MPLHVVNDLADPRIAPYVDLRYSTVAQDLGAFVCEGRLLVDRLLLSRFAVHSLMLEERYVEKYRERVAPDIPIFVITDGTVEQVVGFNFHRGVLACGRRDPIRCPRPEWISTDGSATFAVCDHVCDPENLGGIIRNAAAFGATAVIMGPTCGDAFSRRCLRVAMGTNLRIPIVETRDLGAIMDWFAAHHVETFATALEERAESLSHVTRRGDSALLFGNEGHGLGRSLIASCDRCITIPMQRDTDSLNVAAASAVFLHHLRAVSSSCLPHGVPAATLPATMSGSERIRDAATQASQDACRLHGDRDQSGADHGAGR